MTSSAPSRWWQAADGRWYPPEQHPATAAAPSPATEHHPPPPPPPPGPMPIDIGPVDQLATLDARLPDRPPYLPPGVELPRPNGDDPARPHPGDRPPLDWPVYRHPVAPPAPPELDARNQLVGVLLVLAGLVVVAASMLPWVTFDGGPVTGHSSGIYRGEGWVTVIAGAAVAVAGGAIAGGARRWWIKGAALAGALVVLAVFAIDVVDIATEADQLVADGYPVDLDQGYGLWTVGAAGACALVLSLVERSPFGP